MKISVRNILNGTIDALALTPGTEADTAAKAFDTHDRGGVMRRVGALVAVLALAVAGPALAQTGTGCAAFKWPVAREQAALGAPDLPVLASGAAFPAIGQAAALSLVPEGSVAYTVKPARPPKVDPSFGAELTLTAPIGGVVQVSLSDDAWIDVVQNGKTLRSIDFSGKPGCPGVRKSVRFAVAPGPLVLAISDAAEASLKLVVMSADP